MTAAKGYKKPPTHTRFAKGKSGNPRGRPKGARNLTTELRDELSERISITEGGVKRMVSKQRGLVKTLYARSIQGDMRAMSQLVKLIGNYLEDDAPMPAAEAVRAEDEVVLRLFEERVRRRVTDTEADGDHD
jgi:Family of unknown function (DUF5681)